MTSILQIDALGKRYGLLPSEVLTRADTFDLYILDAALTFEKYHHDKAMNKGQSPPGEYTVEELQEIMAKARQ